MANVISTDHQIRKTEIVRDFHELYYNDFENTWETTTFLGYKVLKNPCDLWIYQELIHETKPDLIIETGTAHGGSALYLASMLELAGKSVFSRVITIDIHGRELYPNRPDHPLIQYITGNSASPETEILVENQYVKGKIKTMVILDSDHSKEHVLKELDQWSSWVTPGCYLIVEDTNIHGNPVVPEHGPGPNEALEEWLPNNSQFERTSHPERYHLTFNPGGYLRRL